MTADALRASWQGKALAATRHHPFGLVVCSVIAQSDDDAMPILLKAVFPDYAGLRPPGLTSAGRIAKTGAIMANIIKRDGKRVNNAALFKDTEQLETSFRHLADFLKLVDADRVEMFDYVKRWIVCDYRLDPRMDPADPDARRYAIH